jgi:2-isopropylmalate synthase
MEDKVRIAQRLDALGIHYIEGGWPGSNPKDLPFFKRVPDAVFKTATISAFGATRRPGVRPQDDANIQALVEAGPPVVTIFGKAWDFHVASALGCGPISKIRQSTSKLSIFSIGGCGPPI